MRGALVRRAWVAGAGPTAWVRGGGDWRRGWAESVRRVLLADWRPCQVSVRVGVWGADLHGVFQQCGVGYAWTLGLVRRQVALSGLLLQVAVSGIGLLLRGGAGGLRKCS
jgi:hypothetical protein